MNIEKGEFVDIIILEYYRAIHFWTRGICYILLLVALSVLSGIFTKEQFLAANPWPLVCMLGMICLFYCTVLNMYTQENHDVLLHLLGCLLGFLTGSVVFYCCFDLLFRLTFDSLRGYAVFIGIDVIVAGIRSVVFQSKDTPNELTDEEKRIASCHEADHALVAVLHPYPLPVQ